MLKFDKKNLNFQNNIAYAQLVLNVDTTDAQNLAKAFTMRSPQTPNIPRRMRLRDT